MVRRTVLSRENILALVLFVLAMMASVVVHEAGHAAACIAYGGVPEITLDVLSLGHGGEVICRGVFEIQNEPCDKECPVLDSLDVYRFAGGAMTSAVFASVLAIPKVRQYVWLYAPAAAVAAGHAVNAILETFAFEEYVYGNMAGTAIILVTFITFALLLTKARLAVR